MRTLRLVSEHGGKDLRLYDEETLVQVPDVYRLEIAPIEFSDGRMHGTVYVRRRNMHGQYEEHPGGEPVLDHAFVQLRIGTIWEV